MHGRCAKTFSSEWTRVGTIASNTRTTAERTKLVGRREFVNFVRLNWTKLGYAFFAVVDDIFKYVSFVYVKLLLNKLQEKALDFFWELGTFVHEVRAWNFFLRFRNVLSIRNVELFPVSLFLSELSSSNYHLTILNCNIQNQHPNNHIRNYSIDTQFTCERVWSNCWILAKICWTFFNFWDL